MVSRQQERYNTICVTVFSVGSHISVDIIKDINQRLFFPKASHLRTVSASAFISGACCAVPAVDSETPPTPAPSKGSQALQHRVCIVVIHPYYRAVPVLMLSGICNRQLRFPKPPRPWRIWIFRLSCAFAGSRSSSIFSISASRSTKWP